jgi:hypothetical protein
MLEYFSAARQAPTKGIFTYQLGQGDGQPPVLNDPSWSLQDGGEWQSKNTFPTYALASTTGGLIMQQLSMYSGNLTDAPFGDQLAESLDRRDYVRLWATVSTDTGAQLPSLWVFLVIVLAILIVAVSGTSIAMHVIQRRRRNDLRRRVLQGQVDLEALGVKRLNVSQQTQDKLPIYTYTASPSDNSEKVIPQIPSQVAGAPSSSVDAETEAKTSPLAQTPPAPNAAGASVSTLNQPTCPICLDDFEENETQVRELPCRHIFHPDCIDTFLLRNSSLCPMCKQSVLPPGACTVPITNMMVRRERHINRMRARGAQPSTISSSQPHTAPSGPLGSLGRRIGGIMTTRRIFSGPERMHQRPSDIEMANNTLPPNTSPPPVIAAPPLAHQGQQASPPPSTTTQNCTPTQNRREWARQRALAMLGRDHVSAASDVEDVNRGPRWRRTLDKVFPGFR